MHNPTSGTERVQARSRLNAAIESARLEMGRRNWEDALRWWDEARELAPEHPGTYAGAAQALRECGRLEEAEQLLLTAAERFPDHEQIALNLASLANLRHDWPTALRRWEWARQKFPANPSSYVGSITALNGAGRMEEADALLPAAEEALHAARTSGSNVVPSIWLELTIAKMRADWATVRRCADALIARDPAPPTPALLARAQACWHAEEVEEAAQSADQVLQRDPASTEALIIGAWAASVLGEGDKALGLYQQLASLHPDTSRWPLKRVELLNWLGDVDKAVAELEVLCARWPDDPVVKAFLKNFGPGSALAVTADSGGEGDEDVFQALEAAAPPESSWLRPLLRPSANLEMHIAAMTGATTAVLVFTGAADGVSMPLAIFDRYLAAMSMTAIYLKDFQRLLYLKGIRSLGSDLPGTITALRGLLASLGIERLVTFGNCDGGHAAIRYGVELGADRIVSVSPATHFPLGSQRLEQARNFKRVRILRNVAPEVRDLQPFLLSRTYGAQIRVVYLQESEREHQHALHIAGAPNVVLQPVVGNERQESALHRLALSSAGLQDTLAAWFDLPIDTSGTLPDGPRA